MYVCLFLQNMVRFNFYFWKVGRLIGRQGVAVKQLQMETRTRVDILDPDPNATGGVDARPSCKFHIPLSSPSPSCCRGLLHHSIVRIGNIIK